MDLKVITGGDEAPRYKYIDGEVTDTRLMGVLGLHMCWHPEGAAGADLDKHLYLYYDIEELGLDQLAVFIGDDELAEEIAWKNLFGGLGANKIGISEREAVYLVHKFVEETRKKGEPLPEAVAEIQFILDKPVTIDDGGILLLNNKMCVPRETDYATCHYYLMRLFGHDPAGAALLAAPGADGKGIAMPEASTFLQNKAQLRTGPDGRRRYLCESLIEAVDSHYIVLSELNVVEGLVESARLKDKFKISDVEAGMKLRRMEYVSVYEICEDRLEFDAHFAAYALGCTVTPHETGSMYMRFRPDNKHVEQSVFNLNDDVIALYYVTEFGQMIVSSYSYEGITNAEASINASGLKECVFPTSKYKFFDSVVFEFANSGFDDFDEFISTIEE